MPNFHRGIKFVYSLSARRAQDRNAAAQYLLEGTNQQSIHADIPFLDRSKSQIWYIYLVISIVGESTVFLGRLVLVQAVQFDLLSLFHTSTSYCQKKGSLQPSQT
jgi:hypothetical protein